MGSGTWERQGSYLSTGASGGYQFVRFPNGESFDESTGLATLYFETGFYVNAGNFYGATFTAEGSSIDQFQVYGPNAYNVQGWTIQVPWNGYRHFWEKSYYNSYSSGYHESVVDFYWYPTLPVYTITYNLNYTGATDTPPENQTKEYGSGLVLRSDVPTRANYKFVGWATSSTATTAEYQPGGQYSANASTTLYAVWELAFVPPTASLTAYRVKSATESVQDPNGAYVLARLTYSIDQTQGTASVNTITETLTEDGVSVTPPDFVPTSGSTGETISKVFAASTGSAYVLTVTVTDTNGVSVTKQVIVPNVKYPIYVYHNNDEDFVKIENLEFGNPAFARAGLEVAQVHILYYNDYNRSTTTIPLTYDNAAVNVSDYDWLKICYTSNVDQWASQDVFKPLGKYVALFTLANWSGDNNAWLKYSMYYIDTSEIRLHNNGWQLALNSGGVTWGDQSGPFEFITQVVGYKL